MNAPQPGLRTTLEFQRADAAHHIHAFVDQKALNAEGPRVMVRGEGSHLWDSEGNRYLDGMSGLWCTNVGYGRPELIDAATRQMKELSYYNMFFHTTHPSVIELSERLFELIGEPFSHVVYTNSGSESNEVLIRTVRRFWDVVGKPTKKVLIGRVNGYHGSTVGSASLGGMAFMHEMGDLPIPNITHVDEPYWFANGGELTPEAFGLQAAQSLERKILELGADNVGAFVAEPFQGAGGMIFPPPGYWQEIERICRKYDVLLCADEVIGGFGRTGEWFAHRYFGFTPDLVCVAKGLTSGYVPMGGLIMSRRIGEALVEKGGVFAHGLTYSGHPVAAAVALANLDVLQNEHLVERTKTDTGPYLQKLLHETFADHPLIGEIQGGGAVAAIQFVKDKSTRERYANEADLTWHSRSVAFELGAIVRSTNGRLIVAPPLVMSHAEIDELVGKMRKAVDATAQWIAQEGF
ncbi:aspartate aminotransferase family protein [Paraburkholderia bannensis]|uniref:aspartate aminotransferase family protein n=1 Tax=Paraburkholderia bannensis TaxID=765414 RepID=UPI000489C37D|nr:aspartate aminotransferase family protein [Paraburkholderia bannensis]